VPKGVWSTLFISPTTFSGALENAAAGVAAGVLSFIGSIGIVPFAAALWLGGASFGGGVGAIVSDLITLPVLNLWRSFMGWRATAYMFVVFFLAMVASALAMQELFNALGALPSRNGVNARLLHVGGSVNFTLVMTIVFLAMTALLYVVKRRGSDPPPGRVDVA
jgi:cbb3-type cytochrome oxidase subunit 3